MALKYHPTGAVVKVSGTPYRRASENSILLGLSEKGFERRSNPKFAAIGSTKWAREGLSAFCRAMLHPPSGLFGQSQKGFLGSSLIQAGGAGPGVGQMTRQ
jgi:hypothetical protein